MDSLAGSSAYRLFIMNRLAPERNAVLCTARIATEFIAPCTARSRQSCPIAWTPMHPRSRSQQPSTRRRGNSLMENTFAMCQEHAVESPGAHAPAVVGSHLAGAADGTVASSHETSEALAWACGFKNASSAMVGRVRSALPEWCLAGVVKRYTARPSAAGADGAIVSTVVEVGRGKPGRVRRQYNGSRVKTRNTDAASFVEFSRAAGVNPSKAWPHGHFQRFLADTPGVKPMTF